MKFPRLNTLNRHLRWLDSVKASTNRLIRPLILTSFFVTAGTLGLRYLGWIEAAELATYDQLVQLKPSELEDDRLLVVGITETDLQSLEEWPVSDRTLAQALKRLEQHQPQTIAVDVFRDFPHEPGTQELTTQIQKNTQTLVICQISTVNDLGVPPPEWVAPEQVVFADFVVDSGGILRRSLLLSGPPEPVTPFPKQHQCNQPLQTQFALSLKVTMQYLAAQGIQADFVEGQIMFGSTVIPPLRPNMGGYRGADTNGYQIMLNYRSEQHAIPEVSLLEVLNNEVDPALIRDRIIFIGYTTPQAKDDFYTPYSIGKDDNQKMPGVIVHAQSASQLISTVLDGRPLIWGWSVPVEILWIVVWAWAGGILGWHLRHPVAFAGVILAGCGGLYGLCLWVFTQGGWIPLVPPAMTFMGTAVGVVLLDRFNQSAYGRQVYRKVTSFLRLKIEIDEAKLEHQVSSITETDYFRQLQQQATSLRRSNLSPSQPKTISGLLTDQLPGEQHQQATDTTKNSPGQATKAVRRPLFPENRATTGISSETKAADAKDDLDFLQHINQKARQFRQQRGITGSQADQASQVSHTRRFDGPEQVTQPAHPVQQGGATNTAPRAQAFVLDTAFCQRTDASAITQDYLAELSKKMTALRSEIKDAPEK